MNWKRCFVMSCSLALVGCGSAVETSNQVSSTPAAPTSEPATSESVAETVAEPTNVTLVTLELPGMT